MSDTETRGGPRSPRRRISPRLALGWGILLTSIILSAWGIRGTDALSGSAPTSGTCKLHPGLTASTYQGAEGEWMDIFGKPGVNRAVYALGCYGDMLVVGGDFDRAGHMEAKYIAGWDGGAWSALGDPEWGAGQDVGEVAIHAFATYESLLVAGGRIRGGGINGVIAAWDGMGWSSLGDLGDPNVSTVKALTLYQGDLVAGGFIPPKRYIAAYDGNVWNTLGEGMNGEVLAVAVYRDELVAAGRFSEADEKPAGRIAKWNGSSWSQLGTGLDGDVYALAVLENCLVAAGNFPGFIAVWNDTSWSAAAEGIPGVVRGLGLCPVGETDSLLYGVGGDGSSGFAVRSRDGSLLDWDSVTQGFDGTVHAIGIGPESGDSTVYFGGAFTAIDAVGANHIALLDEDLFTHLGPPGYGLDRDVEALGVFGSDLLAATWPPSVIAWDGYAWRTLAGQADGSINSILSHGEYLFAGGAFTEIDGQMLLHIAMWDGTSWNPLGAGLSGNVNDLVIYDGSLVVAGSFSQAGGVTADNIAMWDGSSWSEVGGGRGHPVQAAAVWDGKLIVSVRNVIQVWDGKSWKLPSTEPTNGTIRHLETLRRFLVAAGDFYEIGGVSARRIAIWDGDSWSAMGGGLEGDTGWPDYWGGVLDLTVYNGSPVAIGYFDSPCLNIARWDGFAWQCLGGLDSWGNALAVWDGRLAVGGTFEVSGGLSSCRIAVWDDFVDPLDSLSADGRDEAILVSWQAPDDAAYSGTLLRYSVEGIPRSPVEGDPVPNGNYGRFEGLPGTDSSFHHAGLPSDVTYYYSAFTFDDLGRFSSGLFTSATTLDKNPPDTVSHFTVTAGIDFLQIRWTNPLNDDFRGTLIRYSTVGYPAHPDSGDPVPNGSRGRFEGLPGSQGSFIHTGVQVARTHYYSAFAYDHEMNHASPVHCRGLVADTSPPELSLGVFQNPYLTRYLDIYLLCSEPADPATVYIKIGSDSLAVRSVEGRQDLWLGEHKLTGGGGILLVIGHAADTTGNSISVSRDFAAGLITPLEGGLVESPDGRLRLAIPPWCIESKAYVTIASYDGGADLTRAGGGTAGIGSGPDASLEGADDAAVGTAYSLAPVGILRGSGARLEMAYGDPGGGCIEPDRYYIDQAGVGRLESYVDPRTRVVTAEVCELGMFSLRRGGLGSSRRFDPGFLNLAPCRPNPAVGGTTITFEIRAPQHVRIAVYDVGGRLVDVVMDRHAGPGEHRVTWEGRSAAGHPLPSGVYFLKIATEHSRTIAKLALIK